MTRGQKIFVPHSTCTVASGDCYREGRCLNDCRKRYEGNCQQQIRELLERVVQLEVRIGQLEHRP